MHSISKFTPSVLTALVVAGAVTLAPAAFAADSAGSASGNTSSTMSSTTTSTL